MMQRFIFLILISISICSFSNCDSQLPSNLWGCWISSVEENEPNSVAEVYRPCDYMQFPPSRFRFSMNLEKNGKCTWLQLAPNDAHYMVSGKWNFDPKNQVLVILDSIGEVTRKFEVIDFQKDLLRLKSLEL